MGPTTPPPPPAITAPAPLQDSMALSCGRGTHAHALELKENGSYVVHSYPNEKNQPDLRMDGLCHDDETEAVAGERRKVLPVPRKDG